MEVYGNVQEILVSWRNEELESQAVLPTSEVPLLSECCRSVRLGTYYISKCPVVFTRLHS